MYRYTKVLLGVSQITEHMQSGSYLKNDTASMAKGK